MLDFKLIQHIIQPCIDEKNQCKNLVHNFYVINFID